MPASTTEAPVLILQREDDTIVLKKKKNEAQLWISTRICICHNQEPPGDAAHLSTARTSQQEQGRGDTRVEEGRDSMRALRTLHSFSN